jgi:DNA-binding transcriptional ArsR family regulator
LSGSGTSGSVTVMPARMPRRRHEKPSPTRNACVTHNPVEALAALADPIRRELVALLAGGERAAGDLAGRFPVSRPAISRHLRVLREAGLVRARTDGKRRLYALDPRPLRELDDWLAPYRDLWAQRLDALDTEIARGRRARTSGAGT